MKKVFLLLVILLGYSCMPTLLISPKTINLSSYSKSNNAKELILSKYGSPSKIENKVKQEIWTYNYSSSTKSNRTVIFDINGKIIKNKKHYKRFHMITGLNRYAYIVYVVLVTLIFTLPPTTTMG